MTDAELWGAVVRERESEREWESRQWESLGAWREGEPGEGTGGAAPGGVESERAGESVGGMQWRPTSASLFDNCHCHSHSHCNRGDCSAPWLHISQLQWGLFRRHYKHPKLKGLAEDLEIEIHERETIYEYLSLKYYFTFSALRPTVRMTVSVVGSCMCLLLMVLLFLLLLGKRIKINSKINYCHCHCCRLL